MKRGALAWVLWAIALAAMLSSAACAGNGKWEAGWVLAAVSFWLYAAANLVRYGES